MASQNKLKALSPRQPLSGQRVRRIPGCFKISTWNVRSIYESGKIHNVVKEMKRLNVQIMGLSETRWPDSGDCTIRDHTMYFSGNNDPEHRNGVGIVISKAIKSAVKSFIPVSDRIIMLKLRAFPMDINIVQIYAPTADKDDALIEEFYGQLEAIMKQMKKNEIAIVMGDFNAKVGQGKHSDTVGNFGLGNRNERGDRLIQFCDEHKLVIGNTLFELPPRRLYTWKSPADTTGNIVRNQIDYITVPKRFRNAIKSVRTYPGADANSDHNPVVCRIEIKLKSVSRKYPSNSIDIKKLHIPEIRLKVQESICETLTEINTSTQDDLGKWNKVKETIHKTCTQLLYKEKVKRKEWMTDEILDLMEERRAFKGRYQQKYVEIHKVIKRKIREAKEEYLTVKCKEIEECESKYDYYNLHKKVKELTAGKKYSRRVGTLMDKDGNVKSEVNELLVIWKEYVEELFNDTRPETHNISEVRTGLPILRSEIEKAISTMKDNRAPGPDGVHVEILKIISESDPRFLDILVKLFNNIYETGKVPEEWMHSTFISIPKKSNAKTCDQHRLISLINHVTKILTKVVQNRIYSKCDSEVSESQFGFRNALGTRDAIFALQVLIQRCRDTNKDVYLCFIDFAKAFDSVNHEQLISILKKAGLDNKDIRLIANFYWGQTACVKINTCSTENVAIKKGVRQGCVLSPLLFNRYAAGIFKEALYEAAEGITLNGEIINNIRFADDTVILASNMSELQQLVGRIQVVSEQYGLKLNVSKTKWMVVSKRQQPAEQLILKNEPVQQVDKYCYLGSIVNSQWDQSVEIKARIEKSRLAFNSMRSLFTSKDLSLELKSRLVRCYVFSILLYGVEAWTMTESLMKKVGAFEMWVYRRILRIPWTDHISNEEVLCRMGKEREIPFNIKKRKLEYLGHIMRHGKYRILQLILQGKTDGKRGPGRRRHSWLHNLRQWYGLTSTELFRRAVNKVKIAMLIANVRNG